MSKILTEEVQSKKGSRWPLASLVLVFLSLAAAIVVLEYQHAQAENERLPLWGNYDNRVCIWHSDTNSSGDEIVHADDYHWDTISLVGFQRTDGVTDQPMVYDGRERNVWQFDGFKLWLKVGATSPGCSIRVHFNIGTGGADGTMYSTLHDSTEGSAIDGIYDFTFYSDGFDADTLGLLERFTIDLIYGDTITNDTKEFNRTFEVRGALYGKD